MQDLLVVLLTLSFTAGLLSFVNPCGFALLPAYASLYLGISPHAGAKGLSPRKVLGPLKMGAASTLGFIAVFVGFGLAVSALGVTVLRLAPWIASVLGVLVALLGLALLIGRSPMPSLAIDVYRFSGLASRYMPLFGVVYAIASLSCTLPVFIYITVQAISLGGVGEAAAVFTSYSLGMGVGMTGFILALAVAGEAARRVAERVLPYALRLAGLVMIVAGGYIVYWQLFVGGLLEWPLW